MLIQCGACSHCPHMFPGAEMRRMSSRHSICGLSAQVISAGLISRVEVIHRESRTHREGIRAQSHEVGGVESKGHTQRERHAEHIQGQRAALMFLGFNMSNSFKKLDPK
ncbi:hypothetical protein FKM82_026029 [Ascaphus truei]